MNRKNEDNQIFISGRIVSDVRFNHAFLGESFYDFDVEITRKSGNCDVIPVIISERIFDVNQDCYGMMVSVSGEYRSFNRVINGKTSLILFVFAFDIGIQDYEFETEENNSILLNGYICKKPVYRMTPKGRNIADVMLAVNRGNGKSDYIPCVLWGRNAVYVSKFGIGTKIGIFGRVQSRKYTKALPDGSVFEKTAYEVSVSSMEVIENE